jgi:uncharacterized RDD family membrane protein YckC
LAAPEKLTIETPEQIALEYSLASAGSRFLALAVDTLIEGAVFIGIGLLALVASMIRGSGAGAVALWMQALLLLAGFCVYYGYFAMFEAVWSGQTPGKRLVGLRVITTSGRPITTFDAIVRNLLRIVDQLPGIYAIGLTSIFMTARNQRLGDLAAGTVVVHEGAQRHEPLPSSAVAGTARLGAHRLQPNEIEAMETFLKRREDLPTFTRDRTAQTLARHVRQRLSIPAGHHPSDEGLIETLVGEYRAVGGRR